MSVSSAKTGTLDAILLSISIATLAFLPTWHHVLGYAGDGGVEYFEAAAPDIRILLALLADVLGVAGLLFCCFRLRASRISAGRSIAASLITFFAAFAIWQLQTAVSTMLSDRVRPIVLSLLTAVPWIVVLAFWIRSRRSIKRPIRVFFLLLSPLFPLMAANGTWHYLTAGRSIVKGHAAGMLPAARSRTRVIWILFDEFDERILVDARPKRAQLPEFDRLASNTLHATHARSPGWETLTAIPSFLLGKIVVDAKPKAEDLLLNFQGRPGWTSFRSQPNLFTKARTAGFNVGVSGWDHPYCRLMGSDLSDCAWDISGHPSVYVERYLRQKSFYKQAAYLLEWQARRLPLLVETLHWATSAPDENRLWRENSIATSTFVFDNALRMLRNSSLDLVFIHLPFPHPPGIWDSKSRRFTNGSSNYLDNLQLADMALGQMRHTLEATGDWDSSAVLVSSDHPYRPTLWSVASFWTPEMAKITQSKWQPYIPFFLKLPKQQQGIAYTREFNTLISGELVLELLQGHLQSGADAAKWLDKP